MSHMTIAITVVALVLGGQPARASQGEEKKRVEPRLPPLTLDQAWREVLASVDGKAEVLSKQLRDAAKQYPELVRSFNILAAHHGYLIDREARHAASAAIPPPFPPDPLGEICRHMPTHCACRNGDMDACLRLIEGEDTGGGATGTPFERVPSCDEVCADYQETLAVAAGFCRAGGKTRVGGQTWGETQDRFDRLLEQLREQDCIDVLYQALPHPGRITGPPSP